MEEAKKELDHTKDNSLKFDQNEDGSFKMTWNNLVLVGYISAEKAQLAQLDVDTQIMIGGKGSGKTVLAMLSILMGFENDEDFNAVGFRKEQGKAIENMSSNFMTHVANLKALGFKLKDYVYGKNDGVYLATRDKRSLSNNSRFKMGSLDMVSDKFSGSGWANGGYTGIKLIDEPLEFLDAIKGDIPTDDGWTNLIDMMDDNLDRFTDTYNFVHHLNLVPKTWICMNRWGEHPAIKEAEKYNPIDKFIELNLGTSDIDSFKGFTKEQIDKYFNDNNIVYNLQRFHTKSIIVQSKRTCYTLNTKFANPLQLIGNKKEKLINEIKDALIEGDVKKLSKALGLESDGDTLEENMLVFNINDYNTQKSLKDLQEEGYKINRLSIGIDLDFRKDSVKTLVPTIELVKGYIDSNNELVREDTKFYVAPIIELPSRGTSLDDHTRYAIQIASAVVKLNLSYKSWRNQKPYLFFDDNSGSFIALFKEMNKNDIKNFLIYKSVKHGNWDIIQRQDTITLGIESKIIHIDKANQKLIRDMKNCQKADINSRKRQTTGKINYLDRIDPLEYSFYPFKEKLWSVARRKEQTWNQKLYLSTKQ